MGTLLHNVPVNALSYAQNAASHADGLASVHEIDCCVGGDAVAGVIDGAAVPLLLGGVVAESPYYYYLVGRFAAQFLVRVVNVQDNIAVLVVCEGHIIHLEIVFAALGLVAADIAGLTVIVDEILADDVVGHGTFRFILHVVGGGRRHPLEQKDCDDAEDFLHCSSKNLF